MRRFDIAVIPGDGIGREVVPAGCRVLDAVIFGSMPGLGTRASISQETVTVAAEIQRPAR